MSSNLVISTLQDGGITWSLSLPILSTSNSIDFKWFSTSSISKRVPSRRFNAVTLKSIILSGKVFWYSSIVPLISLPPPISAMSCVARFNAIMVPLGSTPRSKRCEASVFNPVFFEVFRMQTGSKYALSRRIFVVESSISEFNPPITPARATGFSPSQIISISGSRRRSFPSRVIKASPSLAVRTTIRFSARRSKSKAWSGCPLSIITKLVISTILLIGFKPTETKRSWSQKGDGPTVISKTRLAAYLGQSSGAIMVIEL